MSETCIFCKIVNGQIPARVISESESALAFLDISPLADGHAVVIPKQHAQLLEQLSDDVREGVFKLVAEVSHKLVACGLGDATTVGINNGAEAGQAVPHVHVHVIPRREGDGGGSLHGMFSGKPSLGLDAVEIRLRELSL